MTKRGRLPRVLRSGRGDGKSLGTGLTLLAGAIAAVVVLPLGWLFIDVVGLGPRAIELTRSPTTIAVLARSVALVTVVTIGSVLVGVPLAVLTVQADIPGRRFWTVLGALPLAIPSYLGAFAAVSAFGPQGALSDLLKPIGIEAIPSIYGFVGASLVLVLYTYPYVFLTTRAALLSLDSSLIQAARTLNVNRRVAFFRVTLPQIAPGIAAGALLVALYTLSDFGTPNIMRVEVFTQFIFARYNAFMRDYAALLSLQLLGVTAVILAIESRLGGTDSSAYESRGPRGALDFDLGYWRWPILLFPMVLAFIAIVLPVGIFGMWLFRSGPGYAGANIAFSWTYGWNSVYVAMLAALGSVALAVPIAVKSANDGSWIGTLANRIPYVGYATPGIVLAIALVSFSLDILPWLYKTIPLLVFAYVVRFMPQAVGTIQTSTMQVDTRYVEAARSLGKTPLQAFRSITFPLIVPGIATGAALVFLTTMKELPATLVLSPLDFRTLVTYIWRVQEAGLYGQAAIPALVLVIVSGISMVVILSQEGGREYNQ